MGWWAGEGGRAACLCTAVRTCRHPPFPSEALAQSRQSSRDCSPRVWPRMHAATTAVQSLHTAKARRAAAHEAHAPRDRIWQYGIPARAHPRASVSPPRASIACTLSLCAPILCPLHPHRSFLSAIPPPFLTLAYPSHPCNGEHFDRQGAPFRPCVSPSPVNARGRRGGAPPAPLDPRPPHHVRHVPYGGHRCLYSHGWSSPVVCGACSPPL